ncbi:MAG TPA: hypothetical protein VGU90_16900, partial [Terriglobales bacterium]|nr:hypothetical protein [Terriglobales bacterium]
MKLGILELVYTSRNQASLDMWISLCFLFILVISSSTQAQVPLTMTDQMSTADHLKQPGWWPLKSNAAKNEYVGPQVCAECHSTLARGQ